MHSIQKFNFVNPRNLASSFSKFCSLFVHAATTTSNCDVGAATVLADRVKELEDALSQVKTTGTLAICSYCKNVRNDQNYWQKVDTYLSDRIDVQFSHGVCPDCLERLTSRAKERKQELAESRTSDL